MFLHRRASHSTFASIVLCATFAVATAALPVSAAAQVAPAQASPVDAHAPVQTEAPNAGPQPAVVAPPVAPLPVEPLPPTPVIEAKSEPPKDKPWYDRIHIRGYTQVRFNRLYTSNDRLKNDLGDKTIGENNGISLRRARLIIYGEVANFLNIYLQSDFAGGTVGEQINFTAMRDWYADINVDPKKEFRFRVGQSKVPYGFENMQSSQNRAPLDRSDGVNSGAPGERDIGAFFYWAPEETRRQFKHLVDSGLKGSGDYGVVALGVYNGQGINAKEKNDNRHVVARVAYPFTIGDQILELGIGGYTGKFNVTKDKGITGVENYLDARINGTIVLYPQPIGFQAEFNVGKGPELQGTEVRGSRPLHGGYAMVMMKVNGFIPYVRGSIYDGGIKTVLNSPRHESTELEVGLEWQFQKYLELTGAVDIANRTIDGKEQKGTVARLQVQFNY
jgi:hypothetical protein